MTQFRRTLSFFVALALCPHVFAAEHTRDSLETIRENLKAKKAVLVDVREADEWKAGHLADAESLPLSQMQQGIDVEKLKKRFSKDKIIYTHCAAGRRSLLAGDELKKHGYDVRPLKPGFNDLLKAGFEKAGN